MRTGLIVVALALGLSGCGGMNFWGDSEPAPAPVAEAAPAPAEQSPSQMPDATPPAAAPAPVMTTQAAAADQPPAASSAVSVQSNTHCTSLAKMRAGDAAAEGEDFDTQEAVYKRVYADCVAWDAAHRP